jgi:hypothetical protein
MKRFFFSFLTIGAITMVAFLTSCGSDNIPPKIYFTEAQDTIVLLQTVFTNPSVIVEDNVDLAEEITLTSDFEDEINLNADGELRYTGDYEITYKATDVAGNSSESIRTVHVMNVSEISVGSYNVYGVYQHEQDTTFTGSISADSKIAGGIRFTRSYLHTEDGDQIWLKINGLLYSKDYSLDITNPTNEAADYFGWMGTSNNIDIPFFYELDYNTALSMMPRYDYIDIPNQHDTIGTFPTEEVYDIVGVKNSEGFPLSKITYLNGEVSTIELQINVTKSGTSNPDVIKETYTLK